ncbi:ankyrin repeat domain-containing protein 18A-like isoform X2 [Anser cygnoides]
MMAVESQHEECVAILLEHRADPNLEGYRGKSALHLAAAAPNTSLAEMLVEHGAHLEAKDWEGNTPLLLAISSHHKEMVKFLLQKGAKSCDKNEFGRTALMLAASAGEMDVIELLLSYGANITCKDIAGYTAVDYALQSGHVGLCKKLVEHARCEKTGEASAGAAQDTAVPSRFCSPRTERFALATLALDGEGALPAVGAEQEEEAELPWDRKDQDRQLQLELPDVLQRLFMSEATPEYPESQHSDMEKGIQCLRAQLNRLKAECQCERSEEKKLVELKCPVEVRLEQEMKRNSELQRECHRLRRLLNGALQKLREYEAREREPQFTTARDMMSSCSEGASEADKLTAKLNELSQQLEMESGKRRQLEAQNCDLQEELSALRGSQEKLEKSNGQLQEEVACIKALLKTYKVGHRQKQQHETEIRKSLTRNKCSDQKSQVMFVFGVLPLILSVRRCSPQAQKSL